MGDKRKRTDDNVEATEVKKAKKDKKEKKEKKDKKEKKLPEEKPAEVPTQTNGDAAPATNSSPADVEQPKKSKKEKKEERSRIAKEEKKQRKELKKKRKEEAAAKGEVFEDAKTRLAKRMEEKAHKEKHHRKLNKKERKERNLARKERKRARKAAQAAAEANGPPAGENAEEKEAKHVSEEESSSSSDSDSDSSVGGVEVAEATKNAEGDTAAKDGAPQEKEEEADFIPLTEPAEQSKNQKFIVFIGNLPFSADEESVKKHFAKITPSHVRVPRDRTNEKGRGFGFLEFDRYDRMKTCLKLYHHSSFDDGKSPARRINVELTAGGGGSKSETRKARIVEKNQKLSEKRARAAKEQTKAKKKEESKASANGDDNANANGAEDESWVHPSRRARVPGQ